MSLEWFVSKPVDKSNTRTRRKSGLREPRQNSQLHQQGRNPDPSNSRSYGDPTDMIGDVHNQLAREQLIPQIANRTRNAINVDRREVFFYQRLRSGRRCTCWESIESSPHSQCPICFSTGFAGGFNKFGTHQFLFDPSRQWFGVNVFLDPGIGVPPWFSLEPEHVSGFVEWDQCLIRANYMGLDSSCFDYRRRGGRIEILFLLEGVDPSFITFTEAALAQRLLTADGRRFRFRVNLSRPSIAEPSPVFQQFWFRGLTLSCEPPVLPIDMPRRVESNVLVEYGALETFQTVNFVFSDEIQRVNLEDVILRLYDMTKWKIIDSSPNDPQNILTSHDVQARKIFEHEIIARIKI